MSYPGLSGYGAYYGSASQSQHAQDTYQPERSNANPAAIPVTRRQYQSSASQPQYDGNVHSWAGQNQNHLGAVSGDAQPYGSNTRRGVNAQQAAYDPQRQQTSNSGSTSISTTSANQAYYGSSSQPPAQHGTNALSNLAYASGLESAVQHDGGRSVNTGRSEPLSFRPPQNTGRTRVPSPAQNTPHYHPNQQHSTSYMAQKDPRSSSSQQDLAASAAAALAGAVNRKYSIHQSPDVASHKPSTVTSSMGNVTSRGLPATQTVQRSASPYGTTSSTSAHAPLQPAQHVHAPSSLARGNYATSQSERHAKTADEIPATMASAFHTRVNSSNKQTSRSAGTGTSMQGNTAQNSSSIANLVTSISPQERSQSTFPPQEASSSTMPNYIDPSQVFNPYHKEYGRQKREAAQAEVEAKRKAAAAPSDPPADASATWSQVNVPNGTNVRPDIPEPPVTDNPKKATKPRAKKGRQSEPALAVRSGLAEAATSPTSKTIEEKDADMASEMKAMVERMREWKSKDPSMFQKLWEDMKKGGAAPSVQAGTLSPQITEATPVTSKPAEVPPPAIKRVKKPRNGQSPGLPTQLNGYKVVVEDNDEELPDLGRFPAERRYRESYTKKNTVAAQDSPVPIDPLLTNTPLISTLLSDPRTIKLPMYAPQGPAVMLYGPKMPATPTPGPQSVPQPLPSRTASGGTIWPEEKRKSLAEAAVKALNADPSNRDKGIIPQTIHDLLEQNPSYIDLCKMLEARGLKFHRGQFARHLLSNVPDLATPQSKSAETPLKPAHADMSSALQRSALEQTIPVPPIASGSGISPARGPDAGSNLIKPETVLQKPTANGQFVTQADVGYTAQAYSTLKADGTPMPRVTKTRLGVPSPNIPPPVPGSKEAMARKRDFSELVDLTQLSDDEDYVMPRKQPRLEESSPEAETFNVETDIRAAASTGFAPPGSIIQPFQFDAAAPRAMPGPGPQPVQRPRTILARSINKSEALRKSYYDPKTVARDILIAAGRHPSERPLNAHLAGLLHRHIELDSDLSTFDWDAVDPGGPPMPRVGMIDIPAGPPKWKLGVHRKGPRREGEPMREQEANHANPAINDTLARLSTQTKNLLQESQRVVNAGVQNPSRLRHSQLAGDTAQDDLTIQVTPQKRRASPTQSPPPSRTRSARSLSQQKARSVESEKRNMEDPLFASGKRRGRPPGSKNKHPSVTTIKKAATTGPLLSIPLRPQSPPVAQFDVYDCRWKKCNAKLHNLETLRKHILKVHRPLTEEAIRVGHTCWWKKCKTLDRNEDKTVTPNTRFKSQDEWMDHIDEAHLHELGMRLGDGPSTAHIGKETFDVSDYFYNPPPRADHCNPYARTVSYTDSQTIAADRARYLSDEHGRAVTAPANKSTNNEYGTDAMVLTPSSNDVEERNPIKHFLRAHGNEKMDLKTSASETLRAVESKKEKVGPGMDRGGCTLVNAERRATLLQNEGITRVVDEDY